MTTSRGMENANTIARTVLVLENNNNHHDNHHDTTMTINTTTTTTTDSYLRILQNKNMDGNQNNNRTTDGPVAVLIVVCVLFCFIWTPMLCQRRWRARNRQLAEEQAAEIIRVSLRNLQILGMEGHHPSQHDLMIAAAGAGIRVGGGIDGGGTISQALSTSRGFTVEDRKEYIHNVLLSRRIVNISTTTPTKEKIVNDDDDDVVELANNNNSVLNRLAPPPPPPAIQQQQQQQQHEQQQILVLADIYDPKQISNHDTMELGGSSCAICLNEFKINDILCSSQNERCTHIFHRDCMEEWLLKNDVCPCCRNNYLSLQGDEEEVEDHQEDEEEELSSSRLQDWTNIFSSAIMGGNVSGGGGNSDGNSDGIATRTTTTNRSRSSEGLTSLGLGGGFGDEEQDGDDRSAYLRGMHLFYLLSRLNRLAATQDPNTTIRLEGLELAGGRRGNLEIEGIGVNNNNNSTSNMASATTTTTTTISGMATTLSSSSSSPGTITTTTTIIPSSPALVNHNNQHNDDDDDDDYDNGGDIELQQSQQAGSSSDTIGDVGSGIEEATLSSTPTSSEVVGFNTIIEGNESSNLRQQQQRRRGGPMEYDCESNEEEEEEEEDEEV